MANPIVGIPDFPIFVWPYLLPSLNWTFDPDVGATTSGSLASQTVSVFNEYGGATLLESVIDSIPIVSAASIVPSTGGPRLSITCSAAGFLSISGAVYLGSSDSSGTFTDYFDGTNPIVLDVSPFGCWQPYSNTPFYEYRDVARAIVSESVSGSVRYRSEWGVKSDGLFSCSNVKRARLFKSAGVFANPGSSGGFPAGFNEAAGRISVDSSGTFEELINAARSVDVLTIVTPDFNIACSIIDTGILSDFTAALTETDGKRMYDVSLPLRHIGFS
jgi:hypothetical protein